MQRINKLDEVLGCQEVLSKMKLVSTKILENYTSDINSWQMNNVRHKFLCMCLFLFITLYMLRAHRAHHQERQILSIQSLVFVCGRVVCSLGVHSQPAHDSATNTD
jgi:hypothetical protein